MAIAFLQSASDGTNATVYTFASQNLGAAAADRQIIVGAIGRAETQQTIDSITVGGVTATITIQNGQGNNVAGIAIANVPTGTTGDIVVTFSGAMARAGIGAWRADVVSALHDSDTSLAEPPSVNLDVPVGFAIGVGNENNTASATWTGLTERYDTLIEATSLSTGASDEFAAPETGRTMTCTFAAGGAGPVGVFASWSYTGGGGGASVGTPIIVIPQDEMRGGMQDLTGGMA